MSELARKLTFEEAMRQLDEIVSAMESGRIGIEESINRYEEAMRLAGQCRKILDEAEMRIRKIQADGAGGVREAPFDAPSGDQPRDAGGD
jgi:exodeoxyribonuclease VII small subunit